MTTAAERRERLIDRYRYTVGWSEEDAAFVARVAEFPSLAAHGETSEAAIAELRFVVREVLKDLAREKAEVPEPLSARHYSGRLSLRLPEYLHRELAIEAAQQGLSLNQLMMLKLSKKLGS